VPVHVVQGLSRWQPSRSEASGAGYGVRSQSGSQIRDLQVLQVVFNLNAGSETDILDSLAGPCIYIAAFLTPVRPAW
jgi:hypothetical protein